MSVANFFLLLLGIHLGFLTSQVQTGPTKDRKGLLPPKRTEKNFRAPKRTYICHFYAINICSRTSDIIMILISN